MEERKVTLDDFTTSYYSSITPIKLILLRVLMIILFIWTMIDMPIVYGNLPMATFTLWNWILIGIYAFLSLLLSLQKIKILPNFPKNIETAYQSFLRRIFEIEFIGAFFVTLIVWALLLPLSYGVDQEDYLLNRPSYFTHGFNFIYIFLELLLTKLYVRKSTIIWFISFVNIYGLFHLLLMLIRDLKINTKPCPSYPFLSVASPLLLPCLLFFTFVCFLLFFVGFKIAKFKRNKIIKIETQLNESQEQSKITRSL